MRFSEEIPSLTVKVSFSYCTFTKVSNILVKIQHGLEKWKLYFICPQRKLMLHPIPFPTVPEQRWVLHGARRVFELQHCQQCAWLGSRVGRLLGPTGPLSCHRSTCERPLSPQVLREQSESRRLRRWTQRQNFIQARLADGAAVVCFLWAPWSWALLSPGRPWARALCGCLGLAASQQYLLLVGVRREPV